MDKLSAKDLETQFQAAEARLRRDAKLAALAKHAESILDMTFHDLRQALGGEGTLITIRQLVDIVRPREKPARAGNGTRLAGEARKKVKDQIVELLDGLGGLGCRDISLELGIPSRRLGSLLKQMRDEGLIQSQGQKVATVYFLPIPDPSS